MATGRSESVELDTEEHIKVKHIEAKRIEAERIMAVHICERVFVRFQVQRF